MASERRFERLYGDELFAQIVVCPLAWLPLGILEHHGGHLPWGLDGEKAHAICLVLAERLGGIVLPACHLAGIHDRLYPGDLCYTEATFRAFLRETFEGLAHLGFRTIVAYTGHYPDVQMEALQAAAETFNQTGAAVVIPFWELLAIGEGDHGGKWETSLYLALHPDAVRLDAVHEDRTGEPGIYRGHRVAEVASAALGQQGLERIEVYLTEAIKKSVPTEGSTAAAPDSGPSQDRRILDERNDPG
jgi:creatinine amidohydrolase/Fe(II)-dependent formamide hydrolase-like protein